MNDDRPRLSEDARVSTMMQEYQGLRREIIGRTSNMFQLFIGAAAEIAWISERFKARVLGEEIDWPFVVVALFIVGGTVLLLFLIYRDIEAAAARLRELENEVNQRAGESLLVWENKHGRSKLGYIWPKGLWRKRGR